MAIPDPATTEWVPLYNKNAIQGPQGPQGIQGPTGPAGASADLDYVGDYVPATYNDGDIVYADDGIAYLCIKDGVTTPPEPWPGTGPVTLIPHATTHNTAGSDALTSISGGIITSGTVADARLSANVPLKNVINLFTQRQDISVLNPELRLIDPTMPVDARVFRIVNSGQSLYIQSVNDAVNAGQGATIIDRLGNTSFSGSIKERSRTTPIGEWITYTPAWYVYSGATPAIGNGALIGRYTIVGKTVFYTIRMLTGSTTNFGGTYWAFSLPLTVNSNSTIELTGGVTVRAISGAMYLGQVIPAAYHFGIANSVGVSIATQAGAVSFITQGHPFTFTVNDMMWITGFYEMA